MQKQPQTTKISLGLCRKLVALETPVTNTSLFSSDRKLEVEASRNQKHFSKDIYRQVALDTKYCTKNVTL